MNLVFKEFSMELELNAQRELFKNCFPENIGKPPESKSFYLWKFHSYPSLPTSFEYAAFDEFGIVGYYAAIPFKYLVKGESFHCGMVCDVMTSSRLRGKGVFTKLGSYSLARLRCAGVDFVSGYPIRSEVIPGHLKNGWRIAFKLPMYVYVVKTHSLLKKKNIELLSPVTDKVAKLITRVGTIFAPRSGPYVTEVSSWEDLVNSYEWKSFVDKWSADKIIVLDKSAEFMNWRLNSPEASYKAICVRQGKMLVGVSIVRITDLQDVPSLAILDLMINKDSRQVFAAIVKAWILYAKTNQCDVIAMMTSRYLASKLAICRFGFIRTPAVFSLIVQSLSERANKMLSTNQHDWSLMWIDSDVL